RTRTTCEPSRGGIGIRLKKHNSRLSWAISAQSVVRLSELAVIPTRARLISTIARNKFIHGLAIETRMSSPRGLRKLSGLTGTGLAQPTRKRAAPEPDSDRKIIINGKTTVLIGSTWISGFKE